MLKKTLATLALAAASITLVGCGGDDGDAASELEAIEEAGTIVIGTEGTYRPFSYHEEGTGDLIGYDVELAQAVAEKLGVEAQFEETQWDAIFAGLEAGRFSMIANQVSINPERQEAYEFSEPYTVSPGVIVVREGDTSIRSFDDLEGKTTAQSLTSNWYQLAQEAGAQVEAVEGWAQSVALLEQGRVDATINDRLTYLDYLQQEPDAPLEIAAETDDPALSAFAFAKGDTELRDAVNEALAELRAEGTIAEISEKYFGEDVSE
ncbi:amino acid ABC transporter substrate-binding protein [Salinibacterium sp. SYSU T00001]|uniref:amino acid ABC transporter substrate-binding protein n=1 Tax=Homoserinimonas sedimenticola TaxID=2986805 RepID=UPI002235BA0D|nr:amino acid ABC transporter substrate-binding protein [Salinibacterium sedimenticola]MCW4385710.1 amino acid ABC transporter substrate-binding protein [Salinibacterium sedimenticola]